MAAYYCLTVRFLQPAFHGRGDRGEPEWPPSPLRAFQSLVAAAAALWNERTRLERPAPALRWLERQAAPTIVAAVGLRSQSKYRLYVPDNVADKVAGSWSRGGVASIADYRTEKDVFPTRIHGGDESVRYLWLASGAGYDSSRDILLAAARGITHLGWGMDMVAADASTITEAEADGLPGERWTPTEDGSLVGLRVPVQGTLDALIEKHLAFLGRIGTEGFRPVPPLTAFRVVGYRRATDPPRRPFAAFSLLRPGTGDFRPFDTAYQGKVVAGMIRHTSARGDVARVLGWSPEKVASFVLGHGEAPGQPHRPVPGPRLAFLPLPSLESRGAGGAEVLGSIRRVLIAASGSRDGDDITQLARILSGVDLTREGTGEAAAMLSRLPQSDRMVRRYTEPATTWATVTPVILPGHDDPRKIRRRVFPKSAEGDVSRLGSDEQRRLLERLDRRIDDLLRKAVRQAGYSDELARLAEIEWRSVGFWPGTEPAMRYEPPDKLRRFRRLHVRITWRDVRGVSLALPGPICLGGGRFIGFGLFAASR